MSKDENFRITAETTMGELNSQLDGIRRADKTPTGKFLRENYKVIAEAQGCKLYENGYCLYENETSSTVMWTPECRSFTFRFMDSEPKPLPEGFLDAQPWYMALVLIGEHRIEANNMNNRQGGRKGSKDFHSADSDYCGDVVDACERRYRSAYVWREDYIGENPESIFIRKEMRHEMLSRMTEKQREVFILYYKYGYDQQEIADILGISRTSVEDRLDGALKKVPRRF